MLINLAESRDVESMHGFNYMKTLGILMISNLEETKTLVATFGFDVDFVLRRIASGSYRKVVLFSLKTKEGEDRVNKAFYALKQVCISLGLECTLDPVEPKGLIRAIYSRLREIIREKEADLYLTGGPRALVISTLLAALMLPDEDVDKLNVVIEGESFDYSWRVRAKVLRDLINLDRRNKKIVLTLATMHALGLAEISKLSDLPKPTALRRLRDLIKSRIVCEHNEKYSLCPEVQSSI